MAFRCELLDQQVHLGANRLWPTVGRPHIELSIAFNRAREALEETRRRDVRLIVLTKRRAERRLDHRGVDRGSGRLCDVQEKPQLETRIADRHPKGSVSSFLQRIGKGPQVRTLTVVIGVTDHPKLIVILQVADALGLLVFSLEACENRGYSEDPSTVGTTCTLTLLSLNASKY